MTFENTEKKSFILQCGAYDFDTIQFDIEEYDDNDFGMYITLLENRFTAYQNTTFFKNLFNRLILCFDILRGKEHRLFDLYVKQEDMSKFKQFINNNIK